MRKSFLLIMLCMCYGKPVFSQNETNCVNAIQQLQAYATQVNQIYYQEYNYTIPNQRCPEIWNGQYVNPGIVQNCRLQALANLNQWYGQQCMYVNNYYSQIVASCGGDPTNGKPGPHRKTGTERNDEIDTDKIENLTAGVDEEKTVRITIPKTAAGFKSD